jgi:MoaA/NifB/PqqE/SkfB family radical SAM enzyme
MNQKEIDSRDKLKEEKPLVYKKVLQNKIAPIIQLQYDYRCNMKCSFCSIQKMQNKKRRSLNPIDVKNICNQADELGLYRIVITGGEPTIIKDLEEIVQAIDTKRFFINMDSNGYLLNEDKIKYLKKIGIDRIQLSIDNLYPEDHDSFRCIKGSHERCMKAVDYCINNNMGIFIQTVVTKQRLHSKEFIDFIEYFNNKGVMVFITFSKPVGLFENHLDEMINEDDLRFEEELEKIYNVCTHLTPGYGANLERHCVAAKNIFSITAYGDCIPCPYFYCSFGNLFEESLETILNRMQSLKFFRKPNCPIAMDKNLATKLYNKELPVNYKEIFNESDFTMKRQKESPMSSALG